MGCLTLYFVHLRLYSYIMITHIRVASQQLEQPRFESPKELVSWMGAIQAQEYEMAKWAIGIRLRSSSLEKVNEALYKGDILRTCDASYLAFRGRRGYPLDAYAIFRAYQLPLLFVR